MNLVEDLNKLITPLAVGSIYEVVDVYRMVSHHWKFVGIADLLEEDIGKPLHKGTGLIFRRADPEMGSEYCVADMVIEWDPFGVKLYARNYADSIEELVKNPGRRYYQLRSNL